MHILTRINKIRLLLFVILFTFLNTSCSQVKKESKNKDVLRLNLSDDPVSLDPRIVRNLKDLTLVKQMFEGLMRLDTDGKSQPAIAFKVDISEDLLTYTFYLREAFWSNHDPVTAYDFEYSWKKTLEPQFPSDYAYMLYPLQNAKLAREKKCDIHAVGVKALDAKTLIVKLHTPTLYFLELVAFPTYFPIPCQADMTQKKGVHSSENQCVSNGPFYLKKWVPQSELILEKNPLYWDSNAVHLDGIVFSIVHDNTTEKYLFDKDQLDWLGQPISNNIATECRNTLKKEGLIFSYPVAGTFWFKFNTEREPFTDVKIRKAFAYAINRKEIINHILQGDQQPATGILPPSMSLNEKPYFEDSDVAAARSLLKEAMDEKGWTKESFPTIILNYLPTERHIKLAQLVQQQWKNAFNVEIELVAMEQQRYWSHLRQGHYQVGAGEWIADFNDPLAFLEIFKYTETGNTMNDTGWHDPTFTSLLDASLTETNPERRKLYLFEAEKILMEQMPIAPVYHYAFDYVKKSSIQNVVLSPLGLVDFKKTMIQP